MKENQKFERLQMYENIRNLANADPFDEAALVEYIEEIKARLDSTVEDEVKAGTSGNTTYLRSRENVETLDAILEGLPPENQSRVLKAFYSKFYTDNPSELKTFMRLDKGIVKTAVLYSAVKQFQQNPQDIQAYIDSPIDYALNQFEPPQHVIDLLSSEVKPLIEEREQLMGQDELTDTERMRIDEIDTELITQANKVIFPVLNNSTVSVAGENLAFSEEQNKSTASSTFGGVAKKGFALTEANQILTEVKANPQRTAHRGLITPDGLDNYSKAVDKVLSRFAGKPCTIISDSGVVKQRKDAYKKVYDEVQVTKTAQQEATEPSQSTRQESSSALSRLVETIQNVGKTIASGINKFVSSIKAGVKALRSGGRAGSVATSNKGSTGGDRFMPVEDHQSESPRSDTASSASVSEESEYSEYYDFESKAPPSVSSEFASYGVNQEALESDWNDLEEEFGQDTKLYDEGSRALMDEMDTVILNEGDLKGLGQDDPDVAPEDEAPSPPSFGK